MYALLQNSMKVFSFCLYGTKKKYCQGLMENIQHIQQFFPGFIVYVYVAPSVPLQVCAWLQTVPFVKMIQTHVDSAELMVCRFYPIDDASVECMFVRDADSRLNGRDKWCIDAFLSSEKQFHIVRDHYWHKTKITGGLWGIKQGILPTKLVTLYEDWIEKCLPLRHQYDTDQKFLQEVVYPLIADRCLIHSNIVGHEGEQIVPIPDNLFSEHHFMGNVYDYDCSGNQFPVFSYHDFPLMEHMEWLYTHKQYKMIVNHCAHVQMFSMDSGRRKRLLGIMCNSYLALKDFEECKRVFALYEHVPVQETDLIMANRFLEHIPTIVATTDVGRTPIDPTEVVICYGDFPLYHHNLPHHNHMYRNAFFYPLCKNQTFEYHPCWKNIKVIYILNLEEQKSRYIELLGELCRMHCPLDRIYHYKAQKTIVSGDRMVDSYIGATKNHLDVVEHFQTHFEAEDGCLILEDDFVFTSTYQENQTRLQTFWQRQYNFDICLLSASKYHETRPYDDLLSLSFQECTTSSGYMLQHKYSQPVLECLREGYEQLYLTGDHGRYVVDRYWSKLQDRNQFFFFKHKIGYQRPNHSSTRSQFVCEFD